MESNYFITDEPNELVANLLTPVAKLGKLGDWNNGYGKYTVAIILLYVGYSISTTGFPMITIDHWFGSLFIYVRYAWFFSIAFSIYKGSFKNNKNLLVINSKGILYNEETFFWNNILSFQLSLEKETKKRYHVYYLHLTTKNNMNHKIDISRYNKKFDEIHDALLKNMGKNEVKDLGFTQMV